MIAVLQYGFGCVSKKIAPRRRSWFGGRGTGGRKKIELRLEIAPEPAGGDIRAGHDGKLGGSPIWRCPEPSLHVAPAGGPGALTAARSGEDRTLQSQVRGRLLGKKTLKAEILKRAFEHATGSKKTAAAAAVAAEGRLSPQPLSSGDWSSGGR